MEVKKVGLLGGRGYVGQEVVQLLAQHKYLNISSVFSLTKAGQPLDLNASSDLIYQDLSIENIVLADEDAYILALPNNESHKYVDLIFQHNSKAIIIRPDRFIFQSCNSVKNFDKFLKSLNNF